MKSGLTRNRYPNKHEKSIKNQSVTEWYRSGKRGAMGKNVECLCCHKVEVVEYFDLLSMIYEICCLEVIPHSNADSSFFTEK